MQLQKCRPALRNDVLAVNGRKQLKCKRKSGLTYCGRIAAIKLPICMFTRDDVIPRIMLLQLLRHVVQLQRGRFPTYKQALVKTILRSTVTYARISR